LLLLLGPGCGARGLARGALVALAALVRAAACAALDPGRGDHGDAVLLERLAEDPADAHRSLLLKTSSPGRYSGETRDYIVQELVMGDKYTASQAGAMGPQAHAHHMTFNQVWNQASGSIDLDRLASELGALRAELKRLAAQPEQDMAVGAIAAAEQAASQKDGPRALEYLARAGQWALDIAGKIGVTVASEALKKALGLK
jgi:hypothetical protein